MSIRKCLLTRRDGAPGARDNSRVAGGMGCLLFNLHALVVAGGPQRIRVYEGHVGRDPGGPDDAAGELRADGGREQVRARQRRRGLGERRERERERERERPGGGSFILEDCCRARDLVLEEPKITDTEKNAT